MGVEIMGERLDDLSDSVKQSGTVILDTTTGVAQGVIVGAYPILMMATVAMLTVALVRLPQMILIY